MDDDDDDGSCKTCGTALDDRRSPVNLDQLFAPLSAKSKECDDLQVAVSEQYRPRATSRATSSLVNDVNARFSNDCTQTVGPYLDAADPSRNVSVRDLFKPLDRKSKEMQNLAVDEPTGEPVKISSHSSTVQQGDLDQVDNDRGEKGQHQHQQANDNTSRTSHDGGGEPRTPENGGKASTTEEQESQSITWKSAAWAKFAPEKLKRTLLRRSSRNQSAAAAAAVQVKKSRFKVVPAATADPRLLSSSCNDTDSSDRLRKIENGLHELAVVDTDSEKLERSEQEAERQPLTAEYDDGGGGGNKDKTSGSKVPSSRTSETHWLQGWLKAFRRKSSVDTSPAPAASSHRPFSR